MLSEQNPIKKLDARFKHRFWQDETEDVALHEYLKKKKEATP